MSLRRLRRSALAALRRLGGRQLAGAGGASAKAALETARGLDTIVDVLYPSGGLRVVASAAAAFAASLGTAGTALFLSVLFALAEGWRMSRVRARRVAANVATRDLNLEGIRRLGNLSLGASARAPAWAGDVVAAAAEAAIGDVEKVQWWNDIMATRGRTSPSPRRRTCGTS